MFNYTFIVFNQSLLVSKPIQYPLPESVCFEGEGAFDPQFPVVRVNRASGYEYNLGLTGACHQYYVIYPHTSAGLEGSPSPRSVPSDVTSPPRPSPAPPTSPYSFVTV